MSAFNASTFNSQKNDTSNKKYPETVNGCVFIFNTGSYPNFGVTNNHAESDLTARRRMFEQHERHSERRRFSSGVAVDEAWRHSVDERDWMHEQHPFWREQFEQLEQEYNEKFKQLKQYYEQRDQRCRQEYEATIKLGRECAALMAELGLDTFEEGQSTFPETLYSQPWQQAGPAQSTPTQASINSVIDQQFCSSSASPEPSSKSRLSNNRTPFNARQAISRKAQSKDEDDNLIKESDTINTPTTISMGASQLSRMAISTRRTSNTTGSKQLTMAINPCRSSVISQDVKENIKSSAPASQDCSGKMVSAGLSSTAGQRDPKTNRVQLLHSVNDICRGRGMHSPTPTSTSSRSLVSRVTMAASTARQQPARVTFSTMTNLSYRPSSVVSPSNPFPISEGNLARSSTLANRTSDKVTGKKVAVANVAQEESDKSKKIRGRPVAATTIRGRR